MLDREKFRILKTLDVAAARLEFRKFDFPVAYLDDGTPVSEDTVILATLHKARLQQPKLFSRVEKDTSRRWLLDNGFELPNSHPRAPRVH